MNAKESVEKLLEDLERQLLVPRARKSKLVFELLAEEFVEFRSSGRQFTEVAQMKTRWILLPETEADHAKETARLNGEQVYVRWEFRHREAREFEDDLQRTL